MFSKTKLYQANDDQVSPRGASVQPILEPRGLLQVEDPGVQRMQRLPATSEAVQLTMCNCAEQAEYLCIDQPQTGMLAVTKQVMLAFMSHWFPCQYRSDDQHQHVYKTQASTMAQTAHKVIRHMMHQVGCSLLYDMHQQNSTLIR